MNSIQVAHLVTFLCIASVVVLNMPFFGGRFRVPDSMNFLVFDTKIAINLAILIGLKVIEVGVCMRVSIFFAVLFHLDGPVEEIAEMLDLDSPLRFFEATILIII